MRVDVFLRVLLPTAMSARSSSATTTGPTRASMPTEWASTPSAGPLQPLLEASSALTPDLANNAVLLPVAATTWSRSGSISMLIDGPCPIYIQLRRELTQFSLARSPNRTTSPKPSRDTQTGSVMWHGPQAFFPSPTSPPPRKTRLFAFGPLMLPTRANGPAKHWSSTLFYGVLAGVSAATSLPSAVVITRSVCGRRTSRESGRRSRISRSSGCFNFYVSSIPFLNAYFFFFYAKATLLVTINPDSFHCENPSLISSTLGEPALFHPLIHRSAPNKERK